MSLLNEGVTLIKILDGAILESLVPIWQNLKNKSLFITISPSSSAKVECLVNAKVKKIKYDCLKQSLQYLFLIRYFRKVYLPIFRDAYFVAVFENNKQGNVHMHILLNDETMIGDQYDLDAIRRSINTHEVTSKYLTCIKDAIHFNHIVFCDSLVETIDYLKKDIHMSFKHYPLMISPNLSHIDYVDTDSDSTISEPEQDAKGDFE